MANAAASAQDRHFERFKDTLFESVSCGDVEKTKTILQSKWEVDINKTVDSKGRNLLHLACEHSHIRMVRWLVSLGADVNKSGYNFWTYSKITPLSLAVLNEHTSIVSALLSEFGCDPNDGVSLHTACEHGHLNMVKTLIECGARVNDEDVDGNTPLHLTVRNETVQLLLRDCMSDPSIKNKEGRTPLHIACLCGNWDSVRLLVEHGASVSAEDIHRQTPLSLAVLSEHTSIVSALLGEFGCVPNDGSLHAACERGNLSMVKTLIEHGASVNDKDVNGNTPLSLALLHHHEILAAELVSEFGCDPNDGVSLHTACKHGNLSMVKTLIEQGASVNHGGVDGNTPLHLTARFERIKTMQAVPRDFKTDPNITNKEGRTPLHIACVSGNLDGVKLLINHGACVCTKDIGNNTPLSLAVLNNHSSIVSALLSEFGCDPNDGVSLHTASRLGDLSMVKTLIEHGATVGVDGNTVLHLTAENGRNETMEAFLRDFKSDPNIKNKKGRTPLHIACMCGNLDGVKLLIKHGASVSAEDIHRYTPLSLAVLNEHTSFLSALVSECGCDPNDGVSLHTACKRGDLSVVETLIEHGAGVINDKAVGDNTPLSLAVLHDHTSIVSALLTKFGCDPNDGVSLHTACRHRNLGMVKTLIEHGARVNDRHVGSDTPLSLAVLHGHNSIVSALLTKFGCDPNDGVSLHTACRHGNLSMVKTLIEHGASVNDKDVDGNTPLSLAVLNGHGSIVSGVVRSFWHTACENGNLSMVKTLVKFGAGVNDQDVHGNTSLHLTVRNERNETIRALLRDFKTDPNIKNKEGSTPLHIACECGNLDGVKLLINHGACVSTKDIRNNTPLSLAVLNNHSSIVSALLSEFGCDPNDGVSLHSACEHGDQSMDKTLKVSVLDENTIDVEVQASEFGSDGVLHTACKHGNLNMVETLIWHGASVNYKGVDGRTPLYYALNHGSSQYTLALLAHLMKFTCDLNVKDRLGMTPLHAACTHHDLTEVKYLIKHGAVVNEEDVNEYGLTLLMTAVIYNKYEIVKFLVSKYGCDANVRGSGGRSLLHVAAAECGEDMLKLLINEYGMSPLLVDREGNTPLHVCSKLVHCTGNVRILLNDFQAPVYIRNRGGYTPMDYAKHYYPIRAVFDEYISQHQGTIEEEYRSMQKLAATRYSGSHCITRVFVVGHPGAGKSSLVEALKREGFIESFNRVSSKSVALHTAGIVPSIHTSDSYGRVQFYDFAGDPEYYSSHAAILEKLFLSEIGNNICIIVLNLQDEDNELERKYFYWLTFINHNTEKLQHLPSVVVTASHADLLSRQGLQKKEYFIKSLLSKYHVYLSLDCCGPRSTNIKLLRQRIKDLSEVHVPYNLSYEGSILLGLLEKDFSNVTACTAKTIASHIAEVNLLRFPRSPSGFYPILKQLQAIGSLLILGGKEGDCYLVLNVAQLTNEVHKRLFSEEAFSTKPDMASFNIGLLPQSLLQEVLPPYITKECLIQLQYCQEISHVEIGQDYSISPSSESAEISSSPDTLLFFPALCKLDRSNISWFIPPEGNYSIGWLARCTNPRDYFPPRFLHVLLLRVSLRFTLVAPTNLHSSQATLPDHVPLKRCCNMWKTGVHWLVAKEGVECEVDVDTSKEVVVSVCSKKCYSKEALTVFNSIISCVMEAKAEFCHSIQLKCFLLDRVGCLSEDNLFQIEEVERVLRDGENSVLSVGGGALMYSSQLLRIGSTFWGSLFILDEKTVLEYLKEIVHNWFQLGIYLDLPKRDLDAIEYNHPRDVERCKIEMVATWLSTYHPHPPCWWTLVKALQVAKDSASAECIKRDLGNLPYVHVYSSELEIH